jgi:hypothetical protein
VKLIFEIVFVVFLLFGDFEIGMEKQKSHSNKNFKKGHSLAIDVRFQDYFACRLLDYVYSYCRRPNNELGLQYCTSTRSDTTGRHNHYYLLGGFSKSVIISAFVEEIFFSFTLFFFYCISDDRDSRFIHSFIQTKITSSYSIEK